MIIAAEAIAQKYAVAFCNVYGDELNDDVIQHFMRFASLIETRRGILVYLMMKSLSHDKKEEMIQKIINRYSLGASFRQLAVLMYRQRRLPLLRLTLQRIVRLYWKRKSTVLFNVESSHPLQESEKQKIISFIQSHEYPKTVRAEFLVTPDLISGIRIKGDVWIWERSIRILLRDVKQSMLQRVGL